MSLHLYSQVSDSALLWREKFVLLRLAFTATDAGLAILPLKKLASDTSFSDDDVEAHLKALSEKGIIQDRSVTIRNISGEISTSAAYQILPELFPRWTPELRKTLLEGGES